VTAEAAYAGNDNVPSFGKIESVAKIHGFRPTAGSFDSWYPRIATGCDASSTKVVQQAQEAATGLKVGMQVFHNKFGEGKVLTLEGSGDDARAQINFPRHGTKWLALSVAKLTPLS
jgi:DNA helicase-2/ATP-dependent DNA helicase PcrA